MLKSFSQWPFCATPTTLKSSRYTKLKSELSKDITILEPDCSEWATMIEHSKIEHNKIKNSIEAVIKNGADVIVLACTHYHWIEEEIKSIAAGRAKILQPEGPIIKQLGHVLNNLNKKSP